MLPLSYKYRIYPNKLQCKALDAQFGFLRFLYNCALEERKSYYSRYKKSLSYNKQASYLKEIRCDDPNAKAIHSQVLQQALMVLDGAFQSFFKRLKSKKGNAGAPRFKGRNKAPSMLFPQCNLISGGVKIAKNNKHIEIHNVPGLVKIEYHRPIEGRCKQVRIVKKNEEYFAIFICVDVPLNILPKTGKNIGIDLGLTNFITQDDGKKIHHPRPLKAARAKLATTQQRLALKKRGSKNYRKTRMLLAKQHSKIVNIREDFQHKLAKQIVNDNDQIFVEDLNIKEMMENERANGIMNNSICDASWNSFINILSYKAERAGRILIKVNPANTSKMCSRCQNVKKDLKLQDRMYHCESCGFAMDRDVNAALNIKRLGLSLAMQASPAFQKLPL